jgi:hypothetical protein
MPFFLLSMKYKIYKANSTVWLICIILKIFLTKNTVAYKAVDGMSTINMIVFLIFAGWVVNDYLKRHHSDTDSDI